MLDPRPAQQWIAAADQQLCGRRERVHTFGPRTQAFGSIGALTHLVFPFFSVMVSAGTDSALRKRIASAITPTRARR